LTVIKPPLSRARSSNTQEDGGVIADHPTRELIKISAKIVSQGRYVTFQMAEITVSRQMLAEILSLIVGCGHRPRQREAPAGANAASDESEGVPWHSPSSRLAPRRRQMANSNVVVHSVRPVFLAEDAQQSDPSLSIIGNPENANL
jgi:hypothetical protein